MPSLTQGSGLLEISIFLVDMQYISIISCLGITNMTIKKENRNDIISILRKEKIFLFTKYATMSAIDAPIRSRGDTNL
jgi:hypothetical protein